MLCTWARHAHSNASLDSRVNEYLIGQICVEMAAGLFMYALRGVKFHSNAKPKVQ